VPVPIDYFANDHRSITLFEEGGLDMPNKKSHAAIQPTLTAPGNGEIFFSHILTRGARQTFPQSGCVLVLYGESILPLPSE
jgi:hypothetical protein